MGKRAVIVTGRRDIVSTLAPARRKPLALLIGVLLGTSGSGWAAGIVSDGGTATTISTAANGRQTVNIAPAVSGVSQNSYSQFNVSQAGASLNNVGVNARNIVNQVTSTNPSLIQGDITVLGPRANVILANPNGITVNGGSFVNTGNVALTTGQVSFNNFIPAPGLTQRNIILNTNQGQIVIGPEGLSGAMLNLELIAKSLVVGGPVVNSFSGSAAGIRAVVGDSHAEIDSSVSPTDNITPWITTTSPHTKSAVTAIDITPLGSLTAGRIELIVTDQGAGVHHAGAMLANVGDFSISATGDVQIAGGTISAARNLIVAAPGLSAAGGVNGNPSLTAGGNVDAHSSSSVQLANATVTAGGDILLGVSGNPSTTDTTIANSNLTAVGGIGVFAQGHALQVNASTMNAQQNVLLGADSINLASGWNEQTAAPTVVNSSTGTVTITSPGVLQMSGAQVNGTAGSIVNVSSLTLAALHSPDGSNVQQAMLQSTGGAVTVKATGPISVTGSDLLAATGITTNSTSFTLQNDGTSGSIVDATKGAVTVNATGPIGIIGSDLLAASDITANSVGFTLQNNAQSSAKVLSAGGAVTINATTGPIGITGSAVQAATGITTHSAGFSMQNDGALQSSMVATGVAPAKDAPAVGGSVSINSTGDITNTGSLIQGNARTAGNSAAVTLVASGNILNQSPDANTLAAIFGVNDDVNLQANGNIENHYGRILTNNALHIAALGDVSNIVDKQAGSNNEQPQTSQSQGTRWLLFTKSTNSFSVDYGQLDRPDQLSYLVSYAGTTISGRNVLNLGGVILANNNSDITINAAQSFQNVALFSGQANFQRSCLIVCHSSASSTVQSVGGNISAGNNINITAGTSASNIGGTVTAAAGNLTVTAPTVLAQGVLGYRAYEQSRGFKSWFGDTWAQLYAMDVGGSWMANVGKIIIDGQEVIDGGSFSGAGGVTATGGVLTLKNPQNDPVTINRHLGLISWLWH
ncbi:filamentous hemagglutinin family protein [Collimonas sp. PA-H2]|uniref:two-partner secretion domain-containing protein n=1 Tax=Collimonas sp. PA-H2 TaxID=1881062 RepID=UPI000BF8A4DE|nr:filamentous hemagglutinin N-terminal domain-containing protein [Collimonas sp. PA-H2]PFH10112.1 filamentous hemagglutinin family protein [Collimonas sp. PA-H2]